MPRPSTTPAQLALLLTNSETAGWSGDQLRGIPASLGYSPTQATAALKSVGWSDAKIQQVFAYKPSFFTKVLQGLSGGVSGPLGAVGEGLAGEGAATAATGETAAGAATAGAGAGEVGATSTATGGLGAGIAATLGSSLDFLKLIAWIFHPRNILRAVEFIVGMVLMVFGIWAAMQDRLPAPFRMGRSTYNQ